MNAVATRLFQHASITLVGALLALIVIALVLASSIGVAALIPALVRVSPFRWA